MIEIYNTIILKIINVINSFGLGTLYNLCSFITNLFIFLNYYMV